MPTPTTIPPNQSRKPTPTATQPQPLPKSNAVIAGKSLRRQLTFRVDKTNIDTRTVSIVVSTDTPCEQWFGMEILDHSPGAILLERLNAAGPLLWNHDSDEQIGCVVPGTINLDSGSGELRCDIKFSRSQQGEENFKDVQDEIKGSISVGYIIHNLILASNVDGVETYRAILWEPYEVSLVSIPADINAGVGRSAPQLAEIEIELQAENPQSLKISKFMKRNILLDAAATDGGGGTAAVPAPAPAPVAAPHVVNQAAIVAERKRLFTFERELDAISNRFADDAPVREYIQSIRGMEPDARPDLAEVQREAMKKIGRPAPLQTPALGQAGGRAYRGVGEVFLDSEDYKKIAARFAGKNKRDVSLGRTDITIEMPYHPRLEREAQKSLMTRADATTSGLTSIEKLPMVVELGVQPPMVADVIPQTGTDATDIRYIQETAFANAAAAVAEDGLIPDATFTYSEADAYVRKIAVIGRVTKELFADYAAMIAYINGRLRYMVDIKEDNHLLNGTGANNQITGLLNFAGINTFAQAGGMNAPDAVMNGALKVRTTGFFEPDAVIMNTNDWANFLMTKDKNGQYLAGGPFTTGAYGNGIQQGMAAPRIWGLPVVPTTNIAQGTCLVGAFRLGSQIFRKLTMVIETTNSDGDDFKYDRMAIKAETRLALACYRPLAFCQVTGLA